MTVTSPGVQSQSQHLETGALVALYTIDLTTIGQPYMWHFTTNKEATFRGTTYQVADIHAEGFEWNGQGAMPRPKIAVSNATRLLSGITGMFNDLVGARLIRLRTYENYLDDQPGADPNEAFDADVYKFEQKIAHDKTKIEWVLSAAMDQQGRMLPKRRLIRSVCMWRYRRYDPNTGLFDYGKVTCPYNGTSYFDRDGDPTTAENDRCGKRISDCEKRYGNEPLPFGGFPGLTRVRL